MTRSPLFYPLNRGMDAEAGGIADLQTDVMRFIAILALCLVAIFALVQSIPLMPEYIETPPELPAIELAPVQQEVRPVMPDPVIDMPETPTPIEQPKRIEQPPAQAIEERPLVITRPVPMRIQRRPPPPGIIEETVAPETVETVAPEALAAPSVSEPTPVAEAQGFTLRFETDLALTRLVARNEVGLYAITPEKSVRMNVNRGAFSFWPASVPNQFHEMDETTVPEDVTTALGRTGSITIGDVKWGVTLPSNMRGQLDKYLSELQGGSLIISGDGNLRLEP